MSITSLLVLLKHALIANKSSVPPAGAVYERFLFFFPVWEEKMFSHLRKSKRLGFPQVMDVWKVWSTFMFSMDHHGKRKILLSLQFPDNVFYAGQTKALKIITAFTGIHFHPFHHLFFWNHFCSPPEISSSWLSVWTYCNSSLARIVSYITAHLL